MIDAVLWWSGLATWLVLGALGLLWLLDQFLDAIIAGFWSRKECMAFVRDRIRARSKRIPGG